MRCPNLSDLPAPPLGRTGWPWTAASARLPDAMPDGRPWPRISVVTPSFNQAAFLEETIRSVLLQGYPDLEYLVLDGASTDGSVEILRRYAPWLDYWASEPDRGQSDAINKGFARASGDWLYWINSDDPMQGDALPRLGPYLAATAAAWIVGRPASQTGTTLQEFPPLQKIEFEDLLYDRVRVPQPSVILRRQVFAQCGGPRLDLHYAMDYEYWLRVHATLGAPVCLDVPLGVNRLYDTTKSSLGWYRYELELADRALATAIASGYPRLRQLRRHWRRQTAVAWSAQALAEATAGRRWQALASLLRALRGSPAKVLRRRSFRSTLKALVLGKALFGIAVCWKARMRQRLWSRRVSVASWWRRTKAGVWHRLHRPPLPENPDGKVYVHLGCGKINHPRYINVDAIPKPHIHYVHGADVLPFLPDNVADLVYASHLLEHFPHACTGAILKEWRRVLKPGGILRLAVPDFDVILRIYEENGADITNVQPFIMGAQNYRFNFHQALFSEKRLRELLRDSGFREVRRWTPGNDDLSVLHDAASMQVERNGKRYAISLNLEAVK